MKQKLYNRTHEFSVLLSMIKMTIQVNKIKESKQLLAELENYILCFNKNSEQYFDFICLKTDYFLKIEEFRKAKRLLENYITDFPVSKLISKNKIYIRLARIYFSLSSLKKSYWALNQFVKDLNNTPLEIIAEYNTEKIKMYLYQGFYQKALNLSIENLDIGFKLKSDEVSIRALLYKSVSLRFRGRHKEALFLIQKAKNKTDNLSDKQLIAEVYNQLGIIYSYMANPVEGIKYLNKALIISNRINNKSLRIQIIANIGTSHEFLGHYDEAFKLHKQSLDLSFFVKNEFFIANSLCNVANILIEFSKFNKAYEYYEHALKIFTHLELPRGKITIYNNLGNFYHYTHEYQKAIKFYEKALSIEFRIEDNYGLANSFNNLGNAYQRLGDLRSAYRFYIKTLELLQGISDKIMLGAILNNLGNLKLEIGSLPKAKEFYSQALKVNKETEFNEAIAMNFSNLAQVSEQQGYFKDALSFYNSAIEYDKMLGKEYNILNHYESIISILLEKNEFMKAESTLGEALKLAEVLKDPDSQAGLQFQYAKLAGYKMQHERAMFYFSSAADIYKKEGNLMAAGECFFNVATLLYERKFNKLAIEFLEKATLLFQEDDNWEELFDSEYFIGKIYFRRNEYTHALLHLVKADRVASNYLIDNHKIKKLIKSIKAHIEKTGKN